MIRSDGPALQFYGDTRERVLTIVEETGLKIAGTMLDYMTHRLATGCPEVRNCIDVALVENLFSRVSPDDAAVYWVRMPDVLKDLDLSSEPRHRNRFRHMDCSRRTSFLQIDTSAGFRLSAVDIDCTACYCWATLAWQPPPYRFDGKVKLR